MKRWVLVVVAVMVIGGAAFGIFESTSSKQSNISPVSSSSQTPPLPNLKSIVPADDKVTGEDSVHLTSSGPSQIVVTYVSESNSAGLVSNDLLLLAWDSFAKRWVTVFDGSKVDLPTEGATSEQSPILPADASVSGLTFDTITAAKGHTDLAFWANASYGVHAPLNVGILHYDGQTATLAFAQTYEPSGSAHLVGKAPHQSLNIDAPWVTTSDPECCAVRDYEQIIGRIMPSQGPAYYAVIRDTRSWLGVYTALKPASSSVSPVPVVVSVVPGSPAAGVLQPGDQLLAVEGVTLTPNANLLGPSVVDEVATEEPGTRVALSIERAGVQQIVNVTLSSLASAANAQAVAPTPGFLGVEVEDETPAIASAYGLGTSSGAVILSVTPGSGAASAGLEQDDIITALGDSRVASASDLEDALLLTPAGTSQQVVYVDPSGSTHSITVQIGSYPSGSVAPQIIPI